MGVNFTKSTGIIKELESSINDVKMDKDSLDVAKARIAGCKHAIQIFAVSLTYNKMKGFNGKKLKTVELED